MIYLGDLFMKKIDALILNIIKKTENKCFDFGLAVAIGALVVAGIAFGVEYVF
jgi:hypothetical protein